MTVTFNTNPIGPDGIQWNSAEDLPDQVLFPTSGEIDSEQVEVTTNPVVATISLE